MDHRVSEAAGIMEESLSELRHTSRTRRSHPLVWRKAQLRAIIDLLHDNEGKISDALLQDLGKHPVESYRDEFGAVLNTARQALNCVGKWMAPRKGNVPMVFFPARGEIVPEPLGTVLIFSSWNYPISLALDPVIGALAAGNTVVLKPSELSPACSSFLAETIPLYLDKGAVKVITGGPEVGARLLELKWDKIFFTGSPRVGQIVMSAAAKHLTPVVLELGGKCPVIVDTLSNATDTKITAKRIAIGKWGPCSGQACIGIDYVLVEEKFSLILIDNLKKSIRKFFGEGPKNTKNMCKIVNKHHFERVRNLIKDPAVAATIIHGGSVDEERLFIEPTILLNPPLDAEIMNEEIFGPLLPIVTLNNIQESIAFVNSKPKPLAMYVFTKDESFKRQMIQETSSGSLTFNDVMIQFICDSLPFGGVGQSGFGRYHGKFSFDTFSHEKAVMRGSLFPEIEPRYPPWNDFKLSFIRRAYNFDYLGLLLMMLGLKRN